ncbi:MAG: hypothetical protein EB132_01745 [Actinobacteria bacterium]|nr:hypothetical protein [Actinomycetota bacterium]
MRVNDPFGNSGRSTRGDDEGLVILHGRAAVELNDDGFSVDLVRTKVPGKFVPQRDRKALIEGEDRVAVIPRTLEDFHESI